MYDIDLKLGEYCREHQWRYTRYADDLTFSGELLINELLRFATKTIEQKQFKVNKEKTRIANRNARQEVTGIIVNDYMQVPRETRMSIRQQIYYIRKFGLDSHLSHIGETRKNYVRHLLGMASHALFINPNDKKMKEIVTSLKQLLETSNTSM